MVKELWAAGVDIGGTKINVIQLDQWGKVGKQIIIPTDVNGGPKAVTLAIAAAINQLSEEVGCPPGAIGIGVAGQVDRVTGVVQFAPNLKWINVSLASEIQQHLSLPVVITNDVRAATWGEWLHGAGRGCSHLLCIFIGTGIGGGIVTAGEMLDGFNNTAGEIGHITVSLDGPVCTCGNWGCLEAYAGGWALAKQAREAMRHAPDERDALLKLAGCSIDEISGIHVMHAASAGNLLAKQIVDRAIDALGACLSGLINSLSPERVIFGGGVVEGNPWLIERTALIIGNRALKAAYEGVAITKGELKNNAGAIGAAALALKRINHP